ncbi:MAG: RIP metalloprotease RseP [Hydrogenovibrio sp.]|nr:RIP metalloprotease RseP [Hydrogenovibrio sp.]
MIEVLWSILGFLVVIGILVTIHEWGHYIVAKAFDVKVLRFSIGFGRPLFRKQVGETEYRLGMIPLGGYVKFLDEREQDVEANQAARAFNRQSVYKRFAIVAAGPLINLVFAWVVFSAIYMIGISGVKPVFEKVAPDSALSQVFSDEGRAWQIVSAAGKSVATWQEVHQRILMALVDQKSQVSFTIRPFSEANSPSEPSREVTLPLTGLDINSPKQGWLQTLGFLPATPEVPPVFDRILDGSPAQKVGVEPGDKLLRINGQSVERWRDFVEFVRAHPNQTVQLELQRGALVYRQNVLLDAAEVNGKMMGRFGASVKLDPALFKSYRAEQSYPFLQAWSLGLSHSVDLVEMSLQMIKGMLLAEISPKNLSGPISIADYSGQALQSGLISFLNLLGLLSLSLGILNLLPIPMLDGGHLMFYVVEILKGRPVSETVELAFQKIGIFIIVGLTMFAFINDVVRITNG